MYLTCRHVAVYRDYLKVVFLLAYEGVVNDREVKTFVGVNLESNSWAVWRATASTTTVYRSGQGG